MTWGASGTCHFRHNGRNAGAQPKVAERVVDRGGAGIGQASHVVLVDPDRVGRAHRRAQHAERAQMRLGELTTDRRDFARHLEPWLKEFCRGLAHASGAVARPWRELAESW